MVVVSVMLHRIAKQRYDKLLSFQEVGGNYAD